MIDTMKYIESRQFDPYHNLALEEYLLNTCERNECILYLWQNQKTVVIGRNQNAWKECKISRLEEDGGHLARRLSGGGAVYHDLGNLNFTFLVNKQNYDVKKQTEVILKAVNALGIPAVRSGRNDLLADGRKFSGNAYYEKKDHCYHHGTLMVDVDKEVLENYLTVEQSKLRSKGVDSVRSRVVNLKELCPDLTIEQLKEALRKAMEEVYQKPCLSVREEDLDQEKLQERQRYFGSWKWRFGRKMEFQMELSHRFSWGGITIQLQVEEGRITDAAVYSDALDQDFILALPAYLKHARCTKGAIAAQLGLFWSLDPVKTDMMQDILAWIRDAEI